MLAVSRVSTVGLNKPLTKRQKQVLEFIRDFTTRIGYSPTLRQIGEGVGLNYTSTTFTHVESLVIKGMLRRAGKALVLTEKAGGPVPVSQSRLERAEALLVLWEDFATVVLDIEEDVEVCNLVRQTRAFIGPKTFAPVLQDG